MKKIWIIMIVIFAIAGCTKEPDRSAYYIGSKTVDAGASDYTSLDNQGIGWGFKKEKGKEPEIDEKTQTLFRKYQTFYINPKRPKTLYLTFDEGYENGYTEKILDVLKEQQVSAAFFITGPYLERETVLVDRMIAEGHIVGNHTVNHPNLPKLSSPEKMAEELNAMNQKFSERYQQQMKYMRPPEGEYSERLLAVSKDLGYQTIFWSFAYKDWDPKHQQGADYAFSQVTPYLHDGAILLLHAVSSDNAEALERIILYAKEQGFSFGSLTELSYL